MVRIRLLLVFFTALCAVHPSYADESVSVRASSKDDYTRIVLEWPTPPSYVTDKSASSLTLKFQKAAAFTIEGAAPSTMPRITSFATPDGKTAQIGFIGGQDVRHFEIGNRVIVDIRGPAKAPVQKSEPVTTPPKEVAPKEAAPKFEVQKEPVAITPPVETVVQTPVVVEEPKAAPPVAPVGTISIQITSTENVAMAAFRRAGNLWIVLDTPDYPLQPQITGSDAKKYGSFERVPLPEATAFRLALPEGSVFHAEGGGLIWKIVSGAAKDAPTGFKSNTDKTTNQSFLLWPASNARRVIEFQDPIIGDMLKVVPVETAKYFTGPPRDYAEFSALPSYVGLAIESKTDDLNVQKVPEGVRILSGDGLSLSSESDIISPRQSVAQQNVTEPKASETPETKDAISTLKEKITDKSKNFFRFSQWKMGNPSAADENRRILMSGLGRKTDAGRAADLLTLAKMELAHGRGAEAIGYLALAQQFVPDLAATPEFLGLHGAADALTGQSETALTKFSHETLKNISEMNLWKTYALASLEDWPQAARMMPKDLSVLSSYTDAVKIPLALAFTETALRDGDTDHATELLGVIGRIKPLSLPYQSAYDYMLGEAARQDGRVTDAEKIWTELKDGKDDLYRARAGLALTVLQLEKKKITADVAIDRLEGLRYAWRGDELEATINQKLGELYLSNNDPIKGLILMRQAALLSPTDGQRNKINAQAANAYNALFQPSSIKNINPVDAITLYTEFGNIVPEVERTAIERQLSDRLVEADLLPRAAGLLQKQVDSGKISGVDGAATALRLASIHLQDAKPDKALSALAKATSFLSTTPADQHANLRKQIMLLQAEALSAQKKPDEAFVVLSRLEQTQDVLRTRADIAWSNKRWQDAADALEELSKLVGISPGRPVNEEQASVLLNWSVALYLADNRFVLANLREKYSAVMATSSKANQFEVVTRPRQSSLLSDKDTINAIIEETEIFKGFVSSSKAANEASAKIGLDTKVVEPPKEAVPPQNQ